MRTRIFLLIVLSFCLVVAVEGQKRLAEFPFDLHTRAMNVNTAIGVGVFQVKVSSPDVLTQVPIITESDEVTKSMFFQFTVGYSAANNINIALAPKVGNKVRITHIEFRVRFGSTNNGNAGFSFQKIPKRYKIHKSDLWE